MGIMSLSEIMDKSIELLRKHIKSIIAFVLLYGVIWMAALVVIIIFSVIAAVASKGLFFILIMPLLIILGIAVLLSANAGIIKIVSQEYFNQRVDATIALKTAFGSLLKVCGLIIIVALMALPFAALFYVIGKAFSGIFGEMISSIKQYSWGIVLLAILLLLTVILVVAIIIGYISIFVFSVHAMVLENKGVIASIKKSYQLVKYNYWKVFGCVILFYTTVYAVQLSISSFIGLIISIFYLILKFLNFSPDFITFFTMVFNYIQQPLSMVSYAVITPINTIMLCLLYFNLRFKKEGLDMRIRLREVQNNYERMRPSGVPMYNRYVQN